eukprot:2499223-Rhodomonas_salina.1
MDWHAAQSVVSWMDMPLKASFHGPTCLLKRRSMHWQVRASWCTYLLEFAAAAQHLLDHWHSLEPELDQAQPASSWTRGPGGPALSMSDFTDPRPLAPPPILDTSSDSNLGLGEAE